ncbi:precorrin-3B synthase [Pseudanabaena sp. FACHB-1277]|uniref:Precorrin-3B synthase n=1 Tax=Pseudanabaena cinerea FACHB-1277 TaxID=2949581 RepID=A0A926US53_9CYAN|nr:precorrin-3B synthase [Pseudanabaena cinerea]MBD2150225.1 precorrin-3B synthase [Pseudanabaena cinerea FACHB-1277]
MQSTTAICPSLFNATTAQDGILSRIRLPAGLITASQCQLISEIVNQFGTNQFGYGEVQITNRANLQIRTSAALSENTLLDLQDYGLASSCPDTDGLRNIMASPAAGIDSQALVNTIPLVKQWNLYLLNHPELAILSNKFSVCFDGGESINISDRPNDICFKALAIKDEIYFSLQLGSEVIGILIPYSQVIAVLAALTEVYRDYTEQKIEQRLEQDSKNLRSRPPRLRELLNDWGIDKYLDLVAEKLNSKSPSIPLKKGDEEISTPPFTRGAGGDQHLESQIERPSPLAPLPKGERGTRGYQHLGIHPQKQAGLAYIGIVVPLGRLTAQQLRGLAELAKQYGGGALRLTPWQNILLTDITIADLAKVTELIANLGLSISPTNPYAAIAACSGITGCKSAHTDTQTDAKAIASHLEKCMQLDEPINFHFSGCDKSCAQHHASDIAIVGQDSRTYKIYIGDGEIHFGRELYAECMASELPQLMERLINVYQTQRQPNQNFREFVNQSDLPELNRKLRQGAIGHA